MIYFLRLLLIGCCIGVASCHAIPPKSTGKGFVVVELFTSEGCSSCPPADALISRIAKENQENVYLLSLHVDYWNRLGWTDPYSSAAYSSRQNDYAKQFHNSSVYTPQVVVNGQLEFNGSDEAKLRSAISKGLAQSQTSNFKSLSASVAGGKIMVNYQLNSASRDEVLCLALVQKLATTAVKRGENEGRLLTHVNVVRHLQELDINKQQTGTVSMDMPAEIGRWQVIGFLQNKKDGKITAAANSIAY